MKCIAICLGVVIFKRMCCNKFSIVVTIPLHNLFPEISMIDDIISKDFSLEMQHELLSSSLSLASDIQYEMVSSLSLPPVIIELIAQYLYTGK